VRRGEGRPADEVFDEIRATLGFGARVKQHIRVGACLQCVGIRFPSRTSTTAALLSVPQPG
jgi:hypothetical protein